MKIFLLPFLLGYILLFAPVARAESPTEAANTDTKKENPPPVTRTPNFHLDLHPALRWTDESSYQPPASEKYIGLWEIKYAPKKWINLSTWNLSWIMGGPSIKARFPIWSNERWAVGSSLGVMSIDLNRLANMLQIDVLKDKGLQMTVIPFQIFGSYRWGEKWILSASIRRYTVSFGADADSAQVDIEGFVATNSTHFRLQAGWALNNNWSFWFISNQLTHQGANGYTYTTLDLDGKGTLEVYLKGQTNAFNFADATSVGLRAIYKRESFLLSMGLDKGNVPIYSLGVVGNKEYPVPHLMIGWRFFNFRKISKKPSQSPQPK